MFAFFFSGNAASKREDARSLSPSLIKVKSVCSGGSISSRLAAETEFKPSGSLSSLENSSSASSESSEAATGSPDAWLEPIDSAPRVACALMGALFRPPLVRSGIKPSSGPAFPTSIDRQFRKAAHQRLDQQSHRQGRLPVLGQDQTSDLTASSPAAGPTHP